MVGTGTDVTRILIAASEFEPFTCIGHLGRVVANLSVALNNLAFEQSASDGASATVGASATDGVSATDGASTKDDASTSDGTSTAKADIRMVLPRYASIPEKYLNAAKLICEFEASLGRRTYACSIYKAIYAGLTIYLVSCGDYFERGQVYSSVVDDVERYSCFCNAVLAMLPRIGFTPDVIQCHDWQMSYIPILYKISRNRRASDENIKTLFVIHNMQFQGICSRYDMLDMLDLPSEYFSPSALEFYGQANSLKGGMLFSDRLVTVSPNYAREIQHAYYGENLEGIVRARSSEISGILCGIDPDIYNPETDNRIYVNYGVSSAAVNKPKNKRRLQQLLGFEQKPDVPVIIVIADELDYDKGMELIKFVFNDIVALGVQLIFAGKGKTDYHDFFLSKVAEYPGKVVYIRYGGGIPLNCTALAGIDVYAAGTVTAGAGAASTDAARAVAASTGAAGAGTAGADAAGADTAGGSGGGSGDGGGVDDITETMLICGSDILLRPSRIEPCGEKHLIALKYGTLPIVRETGGLKDVIVSYNNDTSGGNGFSFFNYNAHDMLYTINRAVNLYREDKDAWNRLVEAAMRVNVTWRAAAKKYLAIYKTLSGAR